MPKESANEERIVYTREERDLLRALVKKYWKVIEDKRTNNSSKEAKLEAWEKLCAEYNCQPHARPRDVKQLKKCWVTLNPDGKKVTRRKSATSTQQALGILKKRESGSLLSSFLLFNCDLVQQPTVMQDTILALQILVSPKPEKN
ncbi:myb/SANT-like DNA-binding domain-containing protein 3 [Ixodes scapularis]